MKSVSEYNKMLNESYSDQSGAKSAFLKDAGDDFKEQLDDKESKFIQSAKMFIDPKSIVFTDGEMAIVVSKKKPYKIIKKLGTASKDIASLVKESINESKGFQVDDLVYNTRTKTVGIVRMKEEKGEVKTDADGNVNSDELEKYNPIKNKHQQKANVAPSTEKEINKRGLFNPFKMDESVIDNELDESTKAKKVQELDKQNDKVNEHKEGDHATLTLSKDNMDKLHKDGSVDIDLGGAIYTIKFKA